MILFLLAAVLCAAAYIAVYFMAEGPKSGTLEWVELYEKPKLSRSGLLHKLKWLDILWCFLMGLMAFGLYAGFGICVDASLAPVALILAALPSVLIAMLAYLLGKSFSGTFLGGLLPALFFACSGLVSHYNAEGALMLGCFLLTLVFFAKSGFWAWFSLVCSGILLALAAWIHPTYIFFALPWLGTVLLAEILRMKQEDLSPWHLILALLAAVLSLGIAVTAINMPWMNPDLQQVLTTPGSYAMFWLQLTISTLTGLFAAPELSPILLLPAASLLAAGVIMAIGGASKKHTLGVILLLWTVFGLVLAVLFPMAFPMFLAALVLAWLYARLSTRGYKATALVTGLVPTAFTVIMTILILWRYVL